MYFYISCQTFTFPCCGFFSNFQPILKHWKLANISLDDLSISVEPDFFSVEPEQNLICYTELVLAISSTEMLNANSKKKNSIVEYGITDAKWLWI